MSPTREELCAYVDGELDPAEMSRVAAQISNSPELQRYVQDQERLLENLHAAFSTIMEQPVPERLVRAANETPLSLVARMRDWIEGTRARQAGPVLRFAVPATALALGVLIGISVEGPTGTPGLLSSSATGSLVARAHLADALDRQLASDQAPAGTRIGVSFRNKAGHDCRTFTVEAAQSVTDGVACRNDGEWQVGALVSGPKAGPAADYQLAGSDMPDAIRGFVSSQISGDPFDAAAERRARDDGWR